MIVLVALWALPAMLIYGWGYRYSQQNAASIVALVVLYGIFVGLLRQWGRRLYRWPNPLQRYGLTGSRGFAVDLYKTLLVGFFAVLGLFGTEVLLGWAIPDSDWPTSWQLLRVVLEGLLVALAVGFAEELLFRGWLLAELERDYSPGLALVFNSLLFALVHFIRPLPEILRTLPQFLGLFILGMALVWARRIPAQTAGLRQVSSLAYPIGFHAGLVWGYYVIKVGDLVEPANRVPEWLTGINGNPLAGLLGLCMLSVIAGQLARLAGDSYDSL